VRGKLNETEQVIGSVQFSM